MDFKQGRIIAIFTYNFQKIVPKFSKQYCICPIKEITIFVDPNNFYFMI
jgi:hypothetical protein